MLPIRALDFVRWAQERTSQGELSLILRRLIRQTVLSAEFVDFPAFEQVSRPGFDGVVVATSSLPQFVPSGRSVWEFGTDKGIKRKADKEIAKRTRSTDADIRRETTFVFVTPRNWNKPKVKWQEDARSRGEWKSVVALDANDLEQWIELAPAVAHWFAEKIGKAHLGATSLSREWKNLRNISEPPLPPTVFTCSRDEQLASLEKWLAGNPSALSIISASPQDGLDFITSAQTMYEQLEDALHISTRDAWEHFVMRSEPLILVTSPSLQLSPADVSGAISTGHRVLICHYCNLGPRNAFLELRRQNHYAVAEALEQAGFPSSRAYQVAKGSCGSSTILKRLVSKHTASEVPEWAREENAAELAPFALLGGWYLDPSLSNKGIGRASFGPPAKQDEAAILELLQMDGKALTEHVTKWTGSSDGFFIRFQNAVFVSSREDAWHHLAHWITPELVDRFLLLFERAFAEDDPKYELPVETRWVANMHGKGRLLSRELRGCLAETLAIMGLYESRVPLHCKVDFRAAIRRAIAIAIPHGANWVRWASLDGNLLDFMEAEPDLILSRMKTDLASAKPQLPELFQDKKHNLFAGALHTNLLWALETAAWNPELLSEAALVLAALAETDPGGTYSNRPSGSLASIFNPGRPHTCAPADDRINVICRVLSKYSDTGFDLVNNLIGNGHRAAIGGANEPRWRDWADGYNRDASQPEISQHVMEIAHLALEATRDCPSRWATSLNHLLGFDDEFDEKVMACFRDDIDAILANKDARLTTWNALFDLLAFHSDDEGNTSSRFTQVLDRLRTILDTLQPEDPLDYCHWLFDQRFRLRSMTFQNDREAIDNKFTIQRIDSLREIILRHGFKGIFDFAEQVQEPGWIGWLEAEHKLLEFSDLSLQSQLDSPSPAFMALVGNYLASLCAHQGLPSVLSSNFDNWSPQAQANFTRCLPANRDSWNWIESRGPDAAHQYWTNIPPIRIPLDPESLVFAVDKLIEVGLPFRAMCIVTWAHYQGAELDPSIIANVLISAMHKEFVLDPLVEHSAHDAQVLIKRLQDDPCGFDPFQLASIEFAFVQCLAEIPSETRPVTLLKMIDERPDFFVQLLVAGSGIVGENPEPAFRRRMLQRTARLFDVITHLPGTDASGQIDELYLANWIAKARVLAADAGALEDCDRHLGAMIARATNTPSGPAPTQAIAEIVQRLNSESLLRGFQIAALNCRGITWRGALDGGEKERLFADSIRRNASNIRDAGPQLANAMKAVADMFESRGRREDDDAERIRLGRH